MIINIDSREQDLLQKIQFFISTIPTFKSIQLITQNLPLGDIIISNDKNEELIIIERKSVNDLLASIKDGRYEEQSYRLNGLNHHNHNIIYLIEGDIGYVNRFKLDNKIEKNTLYSAIFSLNYYKGFSVLRSFSLEETATMICNMAYKLEKEKVSGKKSFYSNLKLDILNKNDEKENDIETNNLVKDKQIEKDYVSIIKKVKKENITIDNISEIMLCQIPGISSVTAITIMKKYHSISNLIKELELNENCLKDLTCINLNGQSRKISKTSILNIVKFLLKK